MAVEARWSRGGDALTGDADSEEIVRLELPADRRFLTVARIVVGGLATRLELSYESLDDLQLAVEVVLGEDGYITGDEVTLELVIRRRSIDVLVAPVDEQRIRDELQAPEDEFGLRVLLSAVADGISFEERDGRRWLRLEKQLPVPARG